MIESGSTAQVLDTPRHPYTRALLDACPRYDRPNAGLCPIPEGIIADLYAELGQSGRAVSNDLMMHESTMSLWEDGQSLLAVTGPL